MMADPEFAETAISEMMLKDRLLAEPLQIEAHVH
jgi:hypothetical protein